MKARAQSAAIRCLDIIAAGTGLLLVTPVLVVIGLWIRATSPGPAVFAQTRIGRFERPFTCYKLRTMSFDTVSVATHEVSARSVTPLGRVLRRLKLDELPQLWNVLIGDMSLVGPRPCLPVQQQLLTARRSHAVLSVRPGITGPGQVNGVDMSEPEKLAALDAVWAAEPSVRAYVGYILRTLVGHGQGDRVREA
ncbi:sugar transferase [Sulfuriferula sp.]|uniref:sugar transferase n=1 Tax=Sulfuriferula sp. TaxID=2025307 RepID=UPI00272FC504|nr:sugar transferase [Sulfuriferula sp.]MDP2024902.1 sugar transferase [Sulfuriferula sp.]